MTIASHLGSSYTRANFISKFFSAGRSDETAWNDRVLKIQITCCVHGKWERYVSASTDWCMRETRLETGSRVWSQNSVKWEWGDGWMSAVSSLILMTQVYVKIFPFFSLFHNQIYTLNKLWGLLNLKDLISLFATLRSITINHHIYWSFLNWRLYSFKVFKMHFPVATGSYWFSFSSERTVMCRNLFWVVWYVTENTTVCTTQLIQNASQHSLKRQTIETFSNSSFCLQQNRSSIEKIPCDYFGNIHVLQYTLNLSFKTFPKCQFPYLTVGSVVPKVYCNTEIHYSIITLQVLQYISVVHTISQTKQRNN